MEAEEEALYIACVVRLVVDIGILQILLREVLGINTCYLVFRCLSHMPDACWSFAEQRRRTWRCSPLILIFVKENSLYKERENIGDRGNVIYWEIQGPKGRRRKWLSRFWRTARHYILESSFSDRVSHICSKVIVFEVEETHVYSGKSFLVFREERSLLDGRRGSDRKEWLYTMRGWLASERTLVIKWED